MADQDIITAARTLKIAHIRADALGGGERGAALSQAYAALLAAVDVDEPEDVTAYRADVERMHAEQIAAARAAESEAPA